MTKLELQNKIAVLEKNISIVKNPAVLANIQKNIQEAKEKLAALEQGTPATASSGGSSELEKLYAQRETLKKGLSSSNPVVQKSAKAALPKVEARIAELEGAAPKPATSPARPAERKPRMESPQPEEIPATKTPTLPSPARRGRPSKMETPAPTPAKRGRKPKAEPPMPMPTPAKRGRKPKVEAPAEIKGKIKRGRKPKIQAPAEIPAKTPAKRGRPSLPKGAKSQEVSLNSLTKFANSIVAFCVENGIADPNLDDVRAILNILDKGKALKFEKGGKISRSGKYISKWQIKQILTDGGMKIGSDELLSGVWLKKKDDGIPQMRMGGKIGYFVINDDILESGKSVMLGTRRISAKNRKFQGVFEGKMVGGLMKVYDYDDEMWKVVNPDEWQQAYAEGGEVGLKREKEKLTNLAYQLQNADEGWIRNNHSEFVQMQNDYKNQFKKVYGHSNYENPNNYAKGGGVENFTLADYKENEQINNHSENALMLTKMYGTQDEIFEVERLVKKGEREGDSEEDYRRIYEISGKYYKHLVEASKQYAEGGGVGNSIFIYNGDNVVYSTKNLLLAKLWVIKNWKKFDELLVIDLEGDSIGITKEDKLKDIEWLFSGSNYAKGGGVENSIFIYDGDNVVYSTKNLLLAEMWVIKNWKKYDELVVTDLKKNSSIVILKEDEEDDIYWQFRHMNYAEGGGVYTSDKIFVLEVRDGETNELLEEKVYRANRYSTALLDAEYDEDLFKKKYGDYLHFKLKEKYAKGGGVGGFSSKEYDKPRGKTIYDVEVEDEDDDKIILEKYDNYDEAISAYARSKYRFPITWRTYLETQKAPFVYEGGIVLTDGTLAVQYRKGKEVKHDFDGNEI
jgi:hypothetical protein